MLATVLQGLFNIVDTFWVGRGLGPVALAGVSTAGFYVWMTLSMAALPQIGLTAVASRRHGEQEPGLAADAAYHALWLGIGVALLVGGGGLLLLPALFALMDTPAEVTISGARYLAVFLSGTPIVFSYFVMGAAFRSAGDTRTPLVLLAIALGLNTVLDPLLILGIGPFPRLGVSGAALATLVTRAGSAALGYHWLVKRDLIRRCSLLPSLLRRIARIGLPAAAAGVVFSFVYVLLTRVTSQFGTAALAALGVGHKVESLGYMVCVGFGLAAATAVGQNLGAGKTRRARKSALIATGDASIFMVLIGILFLAFPGALIGLFTTDPGVIAAGSSYLVIVAVAQIFMALELVLELAMSGAGYTAPPMIATITLTVLRLPVALALVMPLGLAGVWWAISATAVLRGVAMAWLWIRGRWKLRAV